MNFSNLKKIYYYLKRNGIRKTLGAVRERIFSPYFKDYSYLKPEEETLLRQKEESSKKKLLFSIVVPAYETKEEYLKQLIDSLLEQTYPFWQLIIADAGESNRVRETVQSYHEERIQYLKLSSNKGISENTNRALEAVKGEYVGLLDHDDFLTADALYEMEKRIMQGKEQGIEYAFLYSDEDKCDETGSSFYEPHFKMDFNLDLLLTNNYICHFLVMKRTLIGQLGLRKEYDGAQDFDLVLRAVGKLWEENKIVEREIAHIPKVLYHWRCHRDSTAANPASKAYAYEAGKRALEDFCRQRGWKTTVLPLAHVGFYKVIYENGIFSQREDIAALGGKEIKRGRIKGSIYDTQGRPIYEGLPKEYSGYVHRAVLTQNAQMLDIKKWKINPLVAKKYETFFASVASKEYDPQKEQKIICDFLRNEGYRLYWDPDLKV